MSYWQALALTLVLEVPAYGAMLRGGLRVTAGRAVAAGAVVNLASHPLAFVVLMPRLAPLWGFLPALVVIEVSVWMLEATLLWSWLRRDADLLYLAGLLANVLSLSAELALVAIDFGR